MCFVCPTCSYPSRLDDGCDNPACVDRKGISAAWRAELIQRQETEAKRRADDEARIAERAKMRAWAHRNGASAL
jgi:hypothetical protein